MKYIIGTTLILWVYSLKRVDPLSKVTLYMLIAGVVYYLGR
jgi:hypothetical protein